MQRTMVAQRTDTAQAVRYVTSRILGDLLSIHEKFGMSTVAELQDLAHDLELGLTHDCLSELRLYLAAAGADEPSRVYVYERVAAGSFAPSAHSGRIERSRELLDGRLEYQVSLRDRETWEHLKHTDQLRIRWLPCKRRSTSGMTERADGGYASGELSLARTMYTR